MREAVLGWLPDSRGRARPRRAHRTEATTMRLRFVPLVLLLGFAAAPPALAGERPFHLLTMGYGSRIGPFCGLARVDSLAWAEVRTGILFGSGEAAMQIGLYRRLLPDVTAMVAINEPLLGDSPRVAREFGRQLHGDVYWKNWLGLALDGKGEQRQLSLCIWKIPIPIAGHLDGVPWVLR